MAGATRVRERRHFKTLNNIGAQSRASLTITVCDDDPATVYTPRVHGFVVTVADVVFQKKLVLNR